MYFLHDHSLGIIVYYVVRARPPDVACGVKIVAIATRSVGAQNGGPYTKAFAAQQTLDLLWTATDS